MISRFLYFVTDCDSPIFPLSAIARHFQVVSIPNSLDDMYWFNWEASGCLVFEFQYLESAIHLLDQIRSEWISIPAVFFDPNPDSLLSGYPSAGYRTATFTSVLTADSNIPELVVQLEGLINRDRVGHPSPLEIRQRFGSLANQERKVLQLSLDGLTSKEIARRIGIRSQTVDKYKRNALVRMKARNLMTLLRQLFQSLSQRFEGDHVDVANPDEQKIHDRNNRAATLQLNKLQLNK